jgi:hypothetical protein
MELFALSSQLANQKAIINKSLQIDTIRNKLFHLPPLQPVSLNVIQILSSHLLPGHPTGRFMNEFSIQIVYQLPDLFRNQKYSSFLKDDKFRE